MDSFADPQPRVVLFTDVVDSTRANATTGDDRARRVWTAHDRGARRLIAHWRGREIGRSDGFLVLFDACRDAIAFAADYHRLLASLETPLEARVGLDRGAVALERNAAADVVAGATVFEVRGLAVPAAARVMSAALGGQTLLTRRVAAGLEAEGGSTVPLHGHGFWRMKGLDEPFELLEAGHEGRPFRAPADVAKAYRVVPFDGAWVAAREIPHNLGAEPDVFVRRDDAVREIARAFDPSLDVPAGARVVTLLGTGGVGKTRLARHYARTWIGDYPGGVWFCDLSAARTLDGVAFAVSQGTGLALGSGDPVEQLARSLVGRGEALILLDNFEQVARLAEATLGVWARTAPAARFLVTSREVLNIVGERVVVLSPMGADEALHLFRARLDADATGRLDAADRAALPALVDLLDRLPLAIELAAARARIVPPAEQIDRIGERFKLLASRGTRHDRQATLRSSLDGSWELLPAVERSALAQSSVFEGGFDLAAFEAVVDVAALDANAWPGDLLQALVEKSLVRRVDRRRFDLLGAIHDYAAEKRGADDDDAAAERHWRYFAGLGEARACADRGIELNNLAAACRRATAALRAGQDEAGGPAVRSLVELWAVLRMTGPFRAVDGLANDLSACDRLTAADRAWVERVRGGADALTGRSTEALAHYGTALELARGSGAASLTHQLACLVAGQHLARGDIASADESLEPTRRRTLRDPLDDLMLADAEGSLAEARSDLPLALSSFAAAMKIAERLGELRWQGGLQGSLGRVGLAQGQTAEARAHLEAALAIAERLGDRQWVGNAKCNLGWLLYETGDLDAARVELVEALRTAREIGHRRLEATSLCNLGLALAASGEHETAIERLEAAARIAKDLGSSVLEAQCRSYLAPVGAIAGRGRARAASSEL